MATPSAQIYSLSKKRKSSAINFNDIYEAIRKYEGPNQCANFPEKGRSLYFSKTKHTKDENEIICGYIHFGSYGMDQAHHEVINKGIEEEIPKTHATTKKFFYIILNNSYNTKSNIPYIWAIQTWGRENPTALINKLIFNTLSCRAQPITNRRHLSSLLMHSESNQMSLFFSKLPKTLSDTYRNDQYSLNFFGKSNKLARIFKSRLAKLLDSNDHSNFIEICENEISQHFSIPQKELDEIKFTISSEGRTRTISYQKLENGIHEKYPLGELYNEGAIPNMLTLKKEFLHLVEEIVK